MEDAEIGFRPPGYTGRQYAPCSRHSRWDQRLKEMARSEQVAVTVNIEKYTVLPNFFLVGKLLGDL
jgi:hypothetical protein